MASALTRKTAHVFWFLNTILQQKEPGLLREIVGTGKVQDDPGITYLGRR